MTAPNKWQTAMAPKVTPSAPRGPITSTTTDTAYGLKALQGECDAVAHAAEGGRNHQLNNSALKLGARVAGGELTETSVRDNLYAAAIAAGLDHAETIATINSGLRAGLANPKSKPPMERAPLPPSSSRLSSSSGSASTAPQSSTQDGPSTSGVQSAGTAATPGGGPESATQTGSTAENADGTNHPTSTTSADTAPPNGDLWRLALVNWQNLWDDDTQEEWIHEPLLPARRLVALYSPPKVGKSLLLLDIAVGISRGTLTVGHTPKRRYHVLYVDFENDPRGDIRTRLQSMAVGPNDLTHLHYLSFPTLAGLDTETGATQLLDAIHAYQCEVVIIDTVSRSVEGEENENDTWLNFYRSTGLRLKQAGVAMIRLDHTGKDESKGQRGGSAKVGDVDAVWKLSREGAGERFMLTCEASRMQIAEKSLAIERLEAPLRHIVHAGGFGAIAKASEEDIITWLDTNGHDDDIGEPAALSALRTAGVLGPTGSQRLVRSALEKRSKRIMF